jgi:hypothetical protein
MGNISARWLSHDRRDQILLPIGNIFCGVAADRTATTRPNFVYNCRQFRAMLDSYTAARWSLWCFVVIEGIDPICQRFVDHGRHFRAMVDADRTTTETTQSGADNGKRPRPPTRPHEPVAVSPSTAIRD